MGEIKFVGGLILTAIFCISITLFFITSGIENDASFNIADEGYNVTSQAMLSNLTGFKTEVVNATDSFYQSEIEQDTSKTGGQFKLGPASALKVTDSTLRQGFKSIFGEDSGNFGFILSTLISFLGLILVLVIWKTWKGGNPE